jgi:transcriptional regulator with XRE-family HTH domain
LKYEYGKGIYQVNFWAKLKQARTNKDLSFGLAKITELSKSYLNEIEKGKSIPRQIRFLAEKLEVSMTMVSLKLDNNLVSIEKF